MKRSRLLLSSGIVATLLVLAVVVWQWHAISGLLTGRRVVTVGLYENAPKLYTSENGRPAGLLVELLESMARIEGWQLRYVPCKWADCLTEAINRGEIDKFLTKPWEDTELLGVVREAFRHYGGKNSPH